jgi:hypothetical protein
VRFTRPFKRRNQVEIGVSLINLDTTEILREIQHIYRNDNYERM